MGNCFSRSGRGAGQRLGGPVPDGSLDQASSSVSADTDRAQRAAAAEARQKAAAHRGLGDGRLAKKLAEEQRTGGTGNRAPELPERQDVSDSHSEMHHVSRKHLFAVELI